MTLCKPEVSHGNLKSIGKGTSLSKCRVHSRDSMLILLLGVSNSRSMKSERKNFLWQSQQTWSRKLAIRIKWKYNRRKLPAFCPLYVHFLPSGTTALQYAICCETMKYYISIQESNNYYISYYILWTVRKWKEPITILIGQKTITYTRRFLSSLSNLSCVTKTFNPRCPSCFKTSVPARFMPPSLHLAFLECFRTDDWVIQTNEPWIGKTSPQKKLATGFHAASFENYHPLGIWQRPHAWHCCPTAPLFAHRRQMYSTRNYTNKHCDLHIVQMFKWQVEHDMENGLQLFIFPTQLPGQYLVGTRIPFFNTSLSWTILPFGQDHHGHEFKRHDSFGFQFW